MRGGGPANIGTIAIAGAGIAGLSAAIALKLAGFPVTVFERETVLEPIGAGIQMGPNATRIMQRWNLNLLGDACEPEAIELRNARSGALLKAIPLLRAARRRYGAPYVTLLRADLQKALFTRTEELGIPVTFGAPVSRVSEDVSGVRVEAGSQSFAAEALIAADGVNSPIRGLAGYRPRRFSTQAVAWRAVLPLGAIPAPLRSAIAIWMAPGAHLVHYPVAGGSLINAVLIIDDVYQAGLEVENAAGYLMDRLTGWASLPRSVIGATEAWLRWRMSGIAKWRGGAGCIQFIGDAWHAMRPYLASGGVMAIEDAEALATNLTDAEGRIEQGLKLFRQRRGRRVWHVARASAQMGRIYHCPAPFDRLRDLTIKAVPAPALLAWNDWLYGVSSVARGG
jgi:salicylate hydroxylase